MISKSQTRPALGTYITITATGYDPKHAIQSAFETIQSIEEKTSFFLPNSDVARINTLTPDIPLIIDEHTFSILSTALELSRISCGLFDVTIASKLMDETFLPSIYKTYANTTWEAIILMDKNTLKLSKKICIDLGGIAKGYAVDEAIKILQKYEVTSGVVNAGGDVRHFGTEAISLDVRHPIHPSNSCNLGNLLHNNAAATSAGYYSRTKNIIPIVNPIVQSCINTYDSVTVIAPQCVIADALTKIVLLDPDNSRSILNRFGARALLLRHDNTTEKLHVFDSYSI